MKKQTVLRYTKGRVGTRSPPRIEDLGLTYANFTLKSIKSSVFESKTKEIVKCLTI